MNQAVAIPRFGRLEVSRVWVASLMVLAVLLVAALLQTGGPASTTARVSIPVAPVQSSVSVPAAAPGYISPFSNSASGGSSFNLADVDLNDDPNCICLGFF